MSTYQEIMVKSIGGFGKSQLFIVLGCALPKFFAAWSMIMMSFAGAQPKWWINTIYVNQTSKQFNFPVY